MFTSPVVAMGSSWPELRGALAAALETTEGRVAAAGMAVVGGYFGVRWLRSTEDRTYEGATIESFLK